MRSPEWRGMRPTNWQKQANEFPPGFGLPAQLPTGGQAVQDAGARKPAAPPILQRHLPLPRRNSILRLPEGESRIAQQFTVGVRIGDSISPAGTAESPATSYISSQPSSGSWMAEKNERCRKKGSSESGTIHPASPCLRKALEFFRFFRFFRLNCCF